MTIWSMLERDPGMERLVDELERLHALRSAGALDETEYAEAKRRILG